MQKKKKKSKRRNDSDDETVDRKPTFGHCVTDAIDECLEAEDENRHQVNPRTLAKEVNFLPLVPAVRGESVVRTRGRAGKLLLAAGAKEEFDHKGNAKLGLVVCSDTSQFLSSVVENHEGQKRKLGATAVSQRVLEVVEEASKEMADNSAEILKYMDMNKYPDDSKQFLNEALADLKETVEKEKPRLGREILDHTVEFALKNGLLSLAAKRSYKKADNVSRAAASGASKTGGTTKATRFEWDPAKHSRQSARPGKALCFDCANTLLRNGDVKLGDDLPEWVFFENLAAVQKHKKARKCGKAP